MGSRAYYRKICIETYVTPRRFLGTDGIWNSMSSCGCPYYGKEVTFVFNPSYYVLLPVIVSSVLLVCYMSTWYTALSKAPATLVSSILVFAPVVTALLQSAILHKAINRPTIYSDDTSHGRNVYCDLGAKRKHTS